MKYELCNAGNGRFSEHDRLSVAEGPSGKLVVGHVCRYAPGDWRIEDDPTDTTFRSAEAAADALTTE
jgi:hypothetical protein